MHSSACEAITLDCRVSYSAVVSRAQVPVPLVQARKISLSDCLYIYVSMTT